MTYRITRQHVQNKVDVVNRMLGHEHPQWDTIGAVRLYSAYGGTGVHRTMNEHGGVTELAGISTLREASQFLSGMIAALRIARDENSTTYSLAEIRNGTGWARGVRFRQVTR